MTWNTITTQITGHTVTAAEWNDIGENMAFLEELAYDESTSNVNVTATTEATANNIISGTNRTYSGTSPVLIHYYCPQARPDNAAVGRGIHFVLFDGATALGELAFIQTPAASSMNMPVHGWYRLTPTAALHQYGVKAWVSAGTGLVANNTGGSATNMPGFVRVCYIPT